MNPLYPIAGEAPAPTVPEPTDKVTKFLKQPKTRTFVLAAGLVYAVVVPVVALCFPETLPDRSEVAPAAGHAPETDRANTPPGPEVLPGAAPGTQEEPSQRLAGHPDRVMYTRVKLPFLHELSVSGLRLPLWWFGVGVFVAVVLVCWPALIARLVAAGAAAGKGLRGLGWANRIALGLIAGGGGAALLIEWAGYEKGAKLVKLAVLALAVLWGLCHAAVRLSDYLALLGHLVSWLWAAFFPIGWPRNWVFNRLWWTTLLPVRLAKDLRDWFWIKGWVDRLEKALAWVFASPLFPLQIALFWAISLADFGSGFGIPDLVWGDTWWMRLWAGVSISLLFANALFVRAILDRQPGGKPPFATKRWSLFGFARRRHGFPDDPAVRQMGAFLARTWLPALAIFYLPVVGRDWARPGDGVPGIMLLGLVSGVVVTVLLVARYEQTWRAWWMENKFFLSLPGFAEKEQGQIPPAEYPVHALATVFGIPAVGFAVVFLFEYLTTNAVWSPVWVVCLLLGLFNIAYGFVSFHFEGLKYILLSLVLLVLLVANTNHPYKMRHPDLDMYAAVSLDKPPEQAPDWRIQTPDMLRCFQGRWTSGPAGPREGKPKLVIVCTTGGGIQAAVWTAVVLEGLERAIPGDRTKGAAGLRDHIRLMTGASGGMQGAALYTADFHNTDRKTALSTQLARDSLWPTLQTMLMHDLMGSAVPWRFDYDRGRRLEHAWSWNCRDWTDGTKPVEPPDAIDKLRLGTTYEAKGDPFDRSFFSLHAEEKECRCPSLVFSPMLVEDCRRVLISNLAVDWFTTARAAHLNGKLDNAPKWLDGDTISVPAIEFWRYFPKAHDTFRVGTAARMSASFPFVGPAVSLPTNPPRRVVDAGYFDNFGINFAALWLHHYRDEIKEHTSGVVIVEIRAYPRRKEKVQFVLYDRDGKPIADTVNWAVSEGSSPLEGIYNLYARSAYFRNDQVLQVLSEEFNRPARGKLAPAVPFFTTVLFECDQPAALSWTLPRPEAQKICEQFGPPCHLHENVRQQVARLKDWFGTGGGPTEW
ncbi:MAG: patatin-like phospholipase family protein [Planctomycetes bacterium]|nr:patatin-like phospholipase family protein [Planctomycetota bacterium]